MAGSKKGGGGGDNFNYLSHNGGEIVHNGWKIIIIHPQFTLLLLEKLIAGGAGIRQESMKETE